MKKNNKMFVALGLAIMMFLCTTESAFAFSYNWSIAKTPGKTGDIIERYEVPFYNGTIYFDFSNLTGECDYCVVELASGKSSSYYIDNADRNIRVTRVGAQKSFNMHFVENIDMNQKMILKITLENDATIGEMLIASGIISY